MSDALSVTRRTLRIVERNALVSVRAWPLFLSGLIEPVLYFVAIGGGLGRLVGAVPAPGGPMPYDAFVAPAMLAVSAMNTTIFGTMFVFFHKLRYARTFDAVLATPMDVRDVLRGELVWTMAVSTLYATAFLALLVALNIAESAWSVLAVPTATLIGFSFGGAGLGLATFMRSYTNFDYVHVAITPLFLFSATFFPLDGYPDAFTWLVRLSPLYQGVALERALIAGYPTPGLIVHVAYLLLMGWSGLRLATRRLRLLLQP